MDPERLRTLLHAVQAGEADVEEAIATLGAMPIEDIGEARLDTHRPLRQGIGEVVYCEPKSPSQVADIFAALAAHHSRVLGTRADEAMAAAAKASGRTTLVGYNYLRNPAFQHQFLILPFLGNVPELGRDSLWQKLVQHRCGGYCFELNSLLGDALAAIAAKNHKKSP